jgi:uncharacterized protein YukE
VARREFPALGFDPAPGEAAAVESAARSVDGAGRTFGDASANVSRLNSSGWTGDAADAFRGQLQDLPRDLDLAARSHQTAARALSEYGTALAARQRRADELESRAAELRAQQQAAVAEVNRIAAQRAPEGSAELADLKSRYAGARSRADGLGGDLEAVLAQARRLHGEHEAAARSAAGAIRGVADAPYREPGWLSRAWSSVKGWISDHADVLAEISTVLKGVSAVLGVLSLVPGLQFLAPFALAAGGIALAIDVAVKLATGKGSWTSIGIDAALTFMPWGKVAGLVRKVPGAAKALDAAGDLLSRGRGLRGAHPLSSAVPGGTAQAIHSASATPGELDALWKASYSELDDVNKARFLQDLRVGPKGDQTFTYNCTRCTVTTDRVLDGSVVQAMPVPRPGAPLSDVSASLGGRFTRATGWDDVVRQMEAAGPGSRGAVGIVRPDGSGHVFNVVHDSNGVVFLDSQVGRFGNLEPGLTDILLNVYRR